ncbi:MAG TPA: hypothetical protein VFK35_00640 [Candidatus Limnocylindrales bacterium]|nr:hypothetical protein [Candidatus Limnocylindrales bacterium]
MIGNPEVVATPTATQAELPSSAFGYSSTRLQGLALTAPSRARGCGDWITMERVAGQCPARARA